MSKIKDITKRVYSGGTPDTRKSEYWNGNIKWLSSGETRNDFIYDTDKKITDLGVTNSSTKLANKNSIVMACAGQGFTRGQTSFLMDDMYINQSVICIEPDNNNVDGLFLYYFFKKNYNFLRKLSDDHSSRGSITTSMIKDLDVELPDLEIQKKVSAILYSLDKKIELNNTINNNLYEMQKCYFRELFKEKEYYETRLENLFTVSAGGDAPKDKKELSTDEYKYPIVSNGIEKEGIYGYSKEYKVDKKSVTISARGTIGYKVLRNYNYYPIVRLISVIPKDGNISSEYLFYALDDIQILGTGTTQQQLTVPMVKDIKIKVYDLDLIKKFTDYSISLNKKIDNNKLENIKLSQLRDTLLPKLMNGEIDLDNVGI